MEGMGSVVHDGPKFGQLPLLHHLFQGDQLGANHRPRFPDLYSLWWLSPAHQSRLVASGWIHWRTWASCGNRAGCGLSCLQPQCWPTHTCCPVLHPEILFHTTPMDRDRRGSSLAPLKVHLHLLCLYHIQQQAILSSLVQIYLWISLPALEVRCGEKGRGKHSFLCSDVSQTFRHIVRYTDKLQSVSDSQWSMRPGLSPPPCAPACGTHKETLVRAFHCAPLWQYYVWERRTLICPLWRKEHFSGIFSPLELYNWSGVPPHPPHSLQPFLPPATLWLSLLPPQMRGTSCTILQQDGGSKRARKTWVWVWGDQSSCVLFMKSGKFYKLQVKFSPTARSYGGEKIPLGIRPPLWSWSRMKTDILYFEEKSGRCSSLSYGNCNNQTTWLGPCPPWIWKLFSGHDGGVTLKREVQETQS